MNCSFVLIPDCVVEKKDDGVSIAKIMNNEFSIAKPFHSAASNFKRSQKVTHILNC